ncbi:hypothetical protein CAOG_05206 [Capsaspora owczarzaki ATCC 30864]|nr:hypothetical protein CAOG_05206 [Capsaspora owczarzaki ATCC 30864]|eukprot:XP_004346891.1 hypothetical protein CAOG_05206 [Capsaspora owczarzaki ATCC 30864]
MTLATVRIALFACLVLLPLAASARDPDEDRNVTEIIRARGFIGDDHKVVTEDGYILTIQRVRAPGATAFKGAVLLQHGFIDSSATWVMTSETNATKSLAFYLAQSGWDVWLGNSRGNIYSRAHTTLSPSDDAFWDFTFDEFAAYDVPAKMEYILRVSGFSSLSYIGHSEGCGQALAAFSSNKTVAAKIDTFVALAPAAFLYNTATNLSRAFELFVSDNDIYKVLGRKSFLEFNSTDDLTTVCNVIPAVCEDVVCAAAGCLNTSSVDPKRLPVILAHYPAGTSVKDMIHLQQGTKKNVFAKFNYGIVENEKRYNSTQPPSWDVEHWTVPPLAVFYGSQDKAADPLDVQHLLSLLPPSALVYVEEVPSFGHGDFVWSMYAADLIYAKVLSLLNAGL